MTGSVQPPPRYAGLDGVRAVAALAVVATHVGFNSGRSLDNGPFAPMLARFDFGVTLFFLLSGFVIFRPFAVASVAGLPLPDTGRFLLRRFVRILPAYWLTIAITLSALTLRNTGGKEWWSYPLLLQTYVKDNVDPSLTQMWTLSVELTFYLLLPLLAAWVVGSSGAEQAVRRTLILLGGLGVAQLASSILAHLAGSAGFRTLIWLPANIDWFALGMLLALISASPLGPNWFRTARTLAAAPGTCWTLAGLLFCLAMLPLAGPRLLFVPTGWEWSIKHYLYGATALFLLAPLTIAPPGWPARLLSWRPLVFLGQISYGIYLWHLPLLLAIQHRLGYRTFEGHFWTLLLLTVASSTAVASLSWYLLERPLIRRLARAQARPRGTSPASPLARMASTTEP